MQIRTILSLTAVLCLTIVLGSAQFPLAFADSPPDKNLLPPLTHMETCERDSNYGFIGAKNWQFALFGTAQATMASDGNAMKFIVTQADGTFWHSQIRFNADTVSGTVYELRFRAKADTPRPLRMDSEFDDEKTKAYHETGLDWTCSLTPQWQTFAYRFIPHDTVNGQNMLPSFSFGYKPGSVWLSDVSLVQLPTGSSLTVPVTDTAGWGLDPWAKDAKGVYQWGLGPQVAATTVGKTAQFIVSGKTQDSWTAWDAHAALKQNTAYTITFRARADVPRSLSVQGEKETDGNANGGDGLNQHVDVNTQWQPYTLTFTTTAGTNGQNKIPEFIVGDADGALWLSDVSFVEGTPPAPTTAPTPFPNTPADSGPKPRVGELKLTGTVMEIHAAAKSVLMAVTAVTQPDGTTATLPAPRPKTIQLGPQTLIVTVDLMQKTLAALKEGDALTVIGKDAGVGKTLTARTVIAP